MIFELDKKVLLYWRFTAAVIFAAVFSALWFVPMIELALKTVLCIVVTAVFIGFIFFFLPMRFKSEVLKVEKGRIICRKGVIFKREYIYPNARLVYVQTVRLPLATCFGLNVLVLRGVGHSLVLPAVTLEQSVRFLKVVSGDE